MNSDGKPCSFKARKTASLLIRSESLPMCRTPEREELDFTAQFFSLGVFSSVKKNFFLSIIFRAIWSAQNKDSSSAIKTSYYFSPTKIKGRAQRDLNPRRPA